MQKISESNRRGAALAAVVIVASSCGSGPATTAPGLGAVLDSLKPGETLPVIARFATPAGTSDIPGPAGDRHARRTLHVRTLMETNAVSARPLRGLLDAHGVRAATPLWIVNGVALDAGASAIRAIASHHGVASVVPDRTFRLDGTAPRAGTPADSAWNLPAIRAPEAWAAGYAGAGAVVAFLDTGADRRHAALSPGWRGGPGDWFDAHSQHAAPFDADGHGTRVAGLAVGGDDGNGPLGVAPAALWIAARIFDDSGKTTLSAVHRAFQWVLDPDGDPATDDAPDVVNNSWGFRDLADECACEFLDDIAALRASDIAVVFAAGDAGPGSSSSLSPANCPGVVSAGSVDRSLAIEGDSSRGPSACGGGIFPALAAPGVEVRTSDLTGGGVFPGSHATVTGTSFAAPHVAGAMAILRGAAPWAGLEAIEAALFGSAVDRGAPGPDNDFGRGIVDVAAALTLLPAPPRIPGLQIRSPKFLFANGTAPSWRRRP